MDQPPSARRKRQQVYELRQVRNLFVVPVEIGPPETKKLNDAGLLSIDHLEDRARIAEAILNAIRSLAPAARPRGKYDASVPFAESPGLSSRYGHDAKPAGGK